MNTIRLSRGTDVWYATHEGPGAREIMRLFGTVKLPTPFHVSTSQDEVRARIQALNPDAQVR